jgi:prepilin-type processing-associated H-X9-DG protein
MNHRKFISLKEIVAVSAIVLVVGAVVAPALTGSIEDIQQERCLSNLRTLAQAFKLYTTDNNGRFPGGGGLDRLRTHGQYNNRDGAWVWFDGMWGGSGGYYYNNPSEPWTWKINPEKGSIWPYTDQKRETYICPADWHAQNPRITNQGAFGLSYAMNSNLLYPGFGDTPLTDVPVFFSNLVAPEKTVLLSEQWPGKNHPSWKQYTDLGPMFDGVFRWWQSTPMARHGNGCNFAMCDGHVEWVKTEDQRSLVFYVNGKPVTNQAYWTIPWPSEP